MDPTKVEVADWPVGEGARTMRAAFVYVTDGRGFDLAKHSTMSLALSQPGLRDIFIFCYRFVAELPSSYRAAMRARGIRLTLEDIGDPVLERHPTKGHVTTPTLLKLSAVQKLIGLYDRIVYLDNDMLVFADLRIETLAFGDAPVAAVIDADLSPTGALRHSDWSRNGYGTDDVGGYFNAGFMIFESRNWQEAFMERYSAALDRHDLECHYKIDCTSNDQCALNSVFHENWLRLPPSYNMQASAKFTECWNNALVRHYCGPRKFMPPSLFRNDGKDVRYLKRIGRAAGLQEPGLPRLYEILFRLNVLRQHRTRAPIRRFMHAVEAQGATSFSVVPRDRR